MAMERVRRKSVAINGLMSRHGTGMVLVCEGGDGGEGGCLKFLIKF